MTSYRLKQAPLQFRMFLLNSGSMAGWVMVLLAALIVLILARPAS